MGVVVGITVLLPPSGDKENLRKTISLILISYKATECVNLDYSL